MDYQVEQALRQKADIWKVQELERTVDNLRRENGNLNESVQRLQNNNQILHEALRMTLHVFVSSDTVVSLDELQAILNQL